MKDHLLVLSFDVMASPKIFVSSLDDKADWERIARCTGIVWYPSDLQCVAAVKDFIMLNEAMCSSTFFTFNNANSSIETPMMDLQPFYKPYSGKDWSWCSYPHVLYRTNTVDVLINSPFQEVGNTLSESTFCLFLYTLNHSGYHSIVDIPSDQFEKIIHETTLYNSNSFVVSDGDSVLIYCGEGDSNALYTYRIYHPYRGVQYSKEHLSLSLSDPLDDSKTMFAISNIPLSDTDWHRIPPNSCMIIRKGQIAANIPLGSQSQGQTAESTPIFTEGNIASSSQLSEILSQSKNIHYQDHPQLAHQRKISNVKKKLTVYHKTLYTYDLDVEYSTHTLRLTPVQDYNQNVTDFKITISGDAETLHYEDVFGNRSINFNMRFPYRELKVEVESSVEIKPMAIDFSKPLRQISIPLFWTPWQRQMMSPYLLPTELPETELRALSEYAMSFVERNRYNLLDTVLNINDTIYRDYQYVSGFTNNLTTPYEVFVMRKGVCQDFASLFICLARLLNIPARYRVGYIYTGGNYENKIQSDASHAWVELYLPFIGWIGFDPTNDVLANQDHVRIACGRNYLDATPMIGTIFKGGSNEKLYVDVKVNQQIVE